VCRSKDLRDGSYGGYFLDLVYIWLNGSTTENTEDKRSTRLRIMVFRDLRRLFRGLCGSAFIPTTSYLVSDTGEEARASDSAYLM